MEPLNLHDYETLAQERMAPAIWDTYAQGSEDEWTLRMNRLAFAQWRFRPRVLVDVERCDTATTVLRTPIAAPILFAPTSLQQLAHPAGEAATARAAHDVNTILVASTLSSLSLEEIAAAGQGRAQWFQLYIYRDERFTRQFLRRVADANYRAIVLTVDTPAIGNRERDRRHQFTLPQQFSFGNFRPMGPRQGAPDAGPAVTWHTRGDRRMLTWDDIAWLRSLTDLPIILKGILTGEDACRAVKLGVDGIIVSNHGGRQLDGTIPTLDALPEVVAAVNGRCEVYVDGGIRRGTDVLKALALGARAVLIGRPVIWGLAVGGAAGVTDVWRILQRELELDMRLAGCSTVANVTPSLVTTRPALGSAIDLMLAPAASPQEGF